MIVQKESITRKSKFPQKLNKKRKDYYVSANPNASERQEREEDRKFSIADKRRMVRRLVDADCAEYAARKAALPTNLTKGEYQLAVREIARELGI